MTLPAAASLSSSSASRFEYHNMAQIQRVAIIGGGSSGLIAATKLIDAGISVTIFEKYSEVGQAWSKTARYDPEVEAPRPPSEAAFVPIARGRQGSRTFVSEEFDFSGSSTSRTDTRDILASSIGVSTISRDLDERARELTRCSYLAYHFHLILLPSSPEPPSALTSNPSPTDSIFTRTYSSIPGSSWSKRSEGPRVRRAGESACAMSSKSTRHQERHYGMR